MGIEKALQVYAAGADEDNVTDIYKYINTYQMDTQGKHFKYYTKIFNLCALFTTVPVNSLFSSILVFKANQYRLLLSAEHG